MTSQFPRGACGASLALVSCLLSACSATVTPPRKDVSLVQGPAIAQIRTPFDTALDCLRGRISPQASFSVGAVVDASGKEQITEGGSGKFVTQGAGDIVQSALFRAGVTVLNRRDPRIIEQEIRWGVGQRAALMPSRYFITGSINSLDFIPGGGADVQVAGLGAQARQTRILVGLDLSVTDTRTGRVVANIPLQKQIVASEQGLGGARFFGPTLVNVYIGGKQREAINFALRQMLNLATFELLTQMMPEATAKDCRAGFHGVLEDAPGSPEPQVAPALSAPAEPAPAAPPPAKPEAACAVSSYVIRFGFDRRDLTEDNKQLLDAAANDIRICGGVRVVLSGHADRAGSESYNMSLSSARLVSVSNYLKAHGVDLARVRIEPFGESKPAVPTPDGQPEAANRRVELKGDGASQNAAAPVPGEPLARPEPENATSEHPSDAEASEGSDAARKAAVIGR